MGLQVARSGSGRAALAARGAKVSGEDRSYAKKARDKRQALREGKSKKAKEKMKDSASLIGKDEKPAVFHHQRLMRDSAALISH